MKKFLLIALGATMLLTAACAAPAAQSNTDTAALEAQLAQMEQEIADLQSQLDTAAADPAAQPSDDANTAAPAVQDEASAAVSPTSAPTAAEPAASTSQSAGTTKTLDDYDLASLQASTAALVEKAKATTPGNDASANYDTYRAMDRELSDMEDQLDRCEDEAEHDYRQGLLSRTELKELERELEKLEDDLDWAEDDLEYRFGIDD